MKKGQKMTPEQVQAVSVCGGWVWGRDKGGGACSKTNSHPPHTQPTSQLRRKVGGTAKDFWKSYVDVQGQNVDKGYVAKDGGAVTIPPGIWALGLTVVGMIAATVAVASHT